MRVLVTRAEDQAEETAAALLARGHEPVLAPLRRVVRQPVVLSGLPPDRVVVTSRNAMAGLSAPAEWRDVPVIAVGETTAAAVRAAGFVRVVAAAGDVRSAVALVLADGVSRKPVLYLAGQPRKPDLEAEMAAIGQLIEVLEVYRMEDLAGFAGPVRSDLASGRIDAVLHFSPASARAYLGAMAEARLAVAMPLLHAALSADVAVPLVKAGIDSRMIRVASRPDQAALLACLAPDREM